MAVWRGFRWFAVSYVVRVKKCCVRGVWGVLQWLPFYAAESCYDLGIQGYSKVALNLAVVRQAKSIPLDGLRLHPAATIRPSVCLARVPCLDISQTELFLLYSQLYRHN
jgi:hypothetical protein